MDKKTRIKGVDYKVIRTRFINDDEEDGFCDVENKEIVLGKDAKPNILIHEELHAVLHEHGVRDLDIHFEHVIIRAMEWYIEEFFERKKK